MRRPVRASGCKSLPSLAALTAGGVFAAGCQGPQCGDSRSEELRTHAAGVSSALAHARPLDAAHEFAVGVGLASHASTIGGMHPSGGAPVITGLPPETPSVPPPEAPVPPINVAADGQMRAVGPHPIDPPAPPVAAPHPPRMRTAGAPARVDPARARAARSTEPF